MAEPDFDPSHLPHTPQIKNEEEAAKNTFPEMLDPGTWPSHAYWITPTVLWRHCACACSGTTPGVPACRLPRGQCPLCLTMSLCPGFWLLSLASTQRAVSSVLARSCPASHGRTWERLGQVGTSWVQARYVLQHNRSFQPRWDRRLGFLGPFSFLSNMEKVFRVIKRKWVHVGKVLSKGHLL